MSNITIKVNDIEVGGNTRQSLLEQLEQAGFQPEYQCRNGVCGACRCKLVDGEVEQLDAMAFLRRGEVLACRSTPKGNVSIDFEYQLPLQLKKVANE